MNNQLFVHSHRTASALYPVRINATRENISQAVCIEVTETFPLPAYRGWYGPHKRKFEE